jgi:fatty acid-binding protein DegV
MGKNNKSTLVASVAWGKLKPFAKKQQADKEKQAAKKLINELLADIEEEEIIRDHLIMGGDPE